MAENLVQEPLTLMAARDGQAPDGVTEATSRGNQIPVIVKDAASIIKVSVSADALLL